MERPLQGRRILLLRSREQLQPFITKIAALGGEAIPFPVIAIAEPLDWGPLDESLRQLERYRWLVITSVNGAERFLDRLVALGLGIADLAPLRVAAVGTTTARALTERGVRVDLVPTEFRGKAMPAAMAAELQPGDRVLMARGDLADPALAAGLTAFGAQVDDRVCYRTVASSPDVTGLSAQLATGLVDYVTFTSGSTVRNLLALLGGPDALAGVRVACIGPDSALVARELGLPVHLVAAPYTLDGLVAALAEDCRKEAAPQ